MFRLERLKSSITEELRELRPRGTTGEKILFTGFAGNIGLLIALMGAEMSGSQEAAEVIKNTVVLPAHATFDGIILVGVFKLRSEAKKGVENLLFRGKRK